MRKLFFSLYFILVLTFIGVGWSLDQIFNQMIEENETSDQGFLYENILKLSAERLQISDKQLWGDMLDSLKNKLNLPLEIESLDDFSLPDNEQQSLIKGGIIYLGNEFNTSFHLRIGDHNNVLSLGPISDTDDTKLTEIILSMIFYLSLAVALLLWFWPLWRNLQILNNTATEFGHGNFDSRAVLPSKSSLFTMANTFNNMAESIQRLIKSQKELTNAVSHELRTPIARLRFGIEMLETIKESEARHKYLVGMNTDISELDALVDEMLTYARLESDVPRLKIREQNLLPVASNLLDKISHEFPAIKVTSNIDSLKSPILLSFDKQYIIRAMENLLRNATKHAQTQIQLNLVLLSDRCEIHIEDDGLGIEVDDRRRIFEPFIRLDSSRDRSSGGSGLGLAIVQRIVKWHQGKIWVTKSDLGGACFCISLVYTHSD